MHSLVSYAVSVQQILESLHQNSLACKNCEYSSPIGKKITQSGHPVQPEATIRLLHLVTEQSLLDTNAGKQLS
jgi:hypothetical protein